MNEEAELLTDPRDSLGLKLPEPEVSDRAPWADDVLHREQIAARLTNLIRHQSLPFTISIHGQWGTGKTFMLKRWQQELENHGFKAIYFNAWEDDFCDDPLLAIIGQLSEYLRKNDTNRLKKILKKVRRNAVPLLRANVNSLLLRHLGLTVETGTVKNDGIDLVGEYLGQARTKGTLKKSLSEMAEAVSKDSEYPLVFIIDELDRCRPTFAIELLERVKHIFDVPNMVFVLGINRDELCKALQSIYGEIDADVYLRRFFDMEFILPEFDCTQFSKHLIKRFNLTEYFASLSESARNTIHLEEFRLLDEYFPALWSRLGLSLRDVDYCVRSMALVGKDLKPRHKMFPWLLGLLITLRLRNVNLYRRLIQGNGWGSEVMDYLDKILPVESIDDELSFTLDLVEAYLYLADRRDSFPKTDDSTATAQLRLLYNGSELTHPEYLSKRVKEGNKHRLVRILEVIDSESRMRFPVNVFHHLSQLIDLQQRELRR